MLNGVTQLAVTKIDVLNKFKEIKAATHYRYDGQVSDQMPFDLCGAEAEPVHQAFAGWQQPLENISDFDDLPAAAKSFLEVLENYLGVPVTMVSTGPERRSLILKEMLMEIPY